MEDAIERLHRAIEYALLATVSGSPDRRGALYARLARALTTQGFVNGHDEISQLPNFEAFKEVLPIIVRDDDGKRSIHPIWDDRSFIAPAIASLAIMFDRMVSRQSDSYLTLTVSKDEEALYGYRLETFSASAYDYSAGGGRSTRAMEPKDWMHVSTVLSGAALAFIKEQSVMQFAPYYLHSLIEGSAPEGALSPPPTLRDPFVSLASAGG